MLLKSHPYSASGTAVEANRSAASSMAVSQLLLDAKRAIAVDTEAALRCIEHAVSILGGEAALPRTSARGGLARWQIDRVKRHIEENLDGPLQVADLAEMAKLSAGYFSSAFKVSFGQSPHAYVLAKRLARAKQLMASSKMSLCAIAVDCGFSDQAHLCRQFRRAYGASPNVWRRSHFSNADDSLRGVA